MARRPADSEAFQVGEVLRHPRFGLLVCIRAGRLEGPLPQWRRRDGGIVVVEAGLLVPLARSESPKRSVG